MLGLNIYIIPQDVGGILPALYPKYLNIEIGTDAPAPYEYIIKPETFRSISLELDFVDGIKVSTSDYTFFDGVGYIELVELTSNKIKQIDFRFYYEDEAGSNNFKVYFSRRIGWFYTDWFDTIEADGFYILEYYQEEGVDENIDNAFYTQSPDENPVLVEGNSIFSTLKDKVRIFGALLSFYGIKDEVDKNYIDSEVYPLYEEAENTVEFKSIKYFRQESLGDINLVSLYPKNLVYGYSDEIENEKFVFNSFDIVRYNYKPDTELKEVYIDEVSKEINKNEEIVIECSHTFIEKDTAKLKIIVLGEEKTYTEGVYSEEDYDLEFITYSIKSIVKIKAKTNILVSRIAIEGYEMKESKTVFHWEYLPTIKLFGKLYKKFDNKQIQKPTQISELIAFYIKYFSTYKIKLEDLGEIEEKDIGINDWLQVKDKVNNLVINLKPHRIEYDFTPERNRIRLSAISLSIDDYKKHRMRWGSYEGVDQRWGNRNGLPQYWGGEIW